jgi:hypothetical protein
MDDLERQFFTARDPGLLPGGCQSSIEGRYATVLGLRPRRATVRPPNLSASASVTSSSRAPRRASANVIRTVAPRPSGISSPEISETRIVLRAMGFLSRGSRDSNRATRDRRKPLSIRSVMGTWRHRVRNLATGCFGLKFQRARLWCPATPGRVSSAEGDAGVAGPLGGQARAIGNDGLRDIRFRQQGREMSFPGAALPDRRDRGGFTL